MGCGKQREATAPIKSLVKLQPWFLSLRWKACLRHNCSLGFSACSEGPAFGQNTLMMIICRTHRAVNDILYSTRRPSVSTYDRDVNEEKSCVTYTPSLPAYLTDVTQVHLRERGGMIQWRNRINNINIAVRNRIY